MFRKFKGLFTLLAILCVSAIAGGSAYFYFGGQESEERSIDNNVEPSGDNNTSISADNILENYEFGKPDLNETYTYYFFPSTLYMELYKNGQNPETVFGYNEVVLNDSGDPALTSDGQPMYNIVTEDAKGVKDTSYNTYYDYLVNSLNNNSSYYLSNIDKAHEPYPITTREVRRTDTGIIDPDFTYYYGHEYFADPYVINNPYLVEYLAGEVDYDNPDCYTITPNAEKTTSRLYNHIHYLHFYLFEGTTNVNVDAEHRGGINNVSDVMNGISPGYTGSFSKSSEYLSPIADENIGAGDVYGINRKLDEISAESYINSESENRERLPLELVKYREQMVEKAQYRNDRFGFWAPFYDWDDKYNADSTLKTEYSASRYLPIKITVNGNLTPDDMAKIIPSVESSMFDNHLYFDFTANGWTYARSTGGEFEYDNAIGGFTAKDLNYIFDIMQNPSKYASVEDGENIIRLFPVFSNGKNYKSDKDAVVEAKFGAGDALRANFTYTDDAKPTIKMML